VCWVSLALDPTYDVSFVHFALPDGRAPRGAVFYTRGELVMRLRMKPGLTNRLLALVAACAATLAAGPSPALAQNDPWCLVNDQKGSTSCAFASRDQCLLSTGGNVGHCIANPATPSPAAPARKSRRPSG
jgi:hypothetical protein